MYNVSVIPYVVKVSSKYAKAGVKHFEKTYFQWARIGADSKPYIALTKMFGKKDPIQDWINTKIEDDSFDKEQLKKMYPKERQLFLLYDHDRPEKNLQMLDISFYLFGKLLDLRVQNSEESKGWAFFYFMDDTGFKLRLTVEEESGAGFTYSEVKAIDFDPRTEPLPEAIVNHKVCLDDCLVELSYDKLKSIFLCGEESDTKINEPEKEAPAEDSDDGPVTGTGTSQPEGIIKKKSEETKEEEKPQAAKPKEKTAKQCGIKVGDDVIYQVRRYSVFQISENGERLKLADKDDIIVRDVLPDDCERIEPEKKKPAKKETKEENKRVVTQPTTATENTEWDDEWDTANKD